MELLDGDLEMKFFEFPEMKRLAIEIQCCSAREKLKEYQTEVSDFKLRNVFWKKICESDQFRGQRIQDFDFWKYTLEGHDFYLPKIDELIKLGDYDSWTTTLFEDSETPKHPSSFLTSLCLKHQKTIEELKKLFPKPQDEKAKILEMS